MLAAGRAVVTMTHTDCVGYWHSAVSYIARVVFDTMHFESRQGQIGHPDLQVPVVYQLAHPMR